MSFYSTSDTIAAGDTVIVYSSRQQIQPLVVQPGLQLQSRYGQFKHEEMVGVTFGSKVSHSHAHCTFVCSTELLSLRARFAVRFCERQGVRVPLEADTGALVSN